ncbi:hypothetical protein ACUHMQ_07320 [Chitinimonas sp. PSY-7]|uniref:hypothetical protein n=1 Tax=Chitinimonas sp. PSY-7 TaxID=3459088 RepID=UPI0040403888
MTRKLPIALLVAIGFSLHCLAADKAPPPEEKGVVDKVQESVKEGWSLIFPDQEKQKQQEAAKIDKKRLRNLTGCAANAKRTTCKCFTKAGGTDTTIPLDKCLLAVDRGVAALAK